MTTLLSGVEPAVAALQAKLAANLPAYVAAVNATITDGVTVDEPAQILDYVPPLDQVMDPSLIGVSPLGGRWEDDTGSSATGRYTLAVVGIVQDADQQALTRKVKRLHRAVISCVMEGRSASPAWGLRDPRSNFGETAGDRPHGSNEAPASFLTWFSIAIEARLDES